MTNLAILIRHQTRPGARADVQRVWERHMAPAVTTNPGHIAYFYCLDEADPDAITAFQVYDDAASSAAFLQTDEYRAYLDEVEPLLTGPPQVTALTPVWSKT